MNHLYVWMTLSDGAQLLVGELRVSEPDLARGGRLSGEFRYHADYLSDSNAFALDPLHLPLGAHPIHCGNSVTGIHGVFEDSLPDAWGRAILSRRFNLTRQQQQAHRLLPLIGAEAMGALSYSNTNSYPPKAEEARVTDLSELAQAVEQFEREPDASSELLRGLYLAGSSPGGARPKVLVRDNDHWIAKLASVNDVIDIVGIEAACLSLAKDAGISVPDYRLEGFGSRRGLLVRRFDCTERGGRNHMLSMQSLLNAQGYYYLGYPDMADLVRRVTDRPGDDLAMLYRQAVFNALLGNTDDHLKNFAMMHADGSWRLTPAYDLLPDVKASREHVLHYGSAGTQPTLQSLPDIGRLFGLAPKRSTQIVEQVASALNGFRDACEQFDVPSADIDLMVQRIPYFRKQASSKYGL